MGADTAGCCARRDGRQEAEIVSEDFYAAPSINRAIKCCPSMLGGFVQNARVTLCMPQRGQRACQFICEYTIINRSPSLPSHSQPLTPALVLVYQSVVASRLLLRLELGGL